MVLFITSSEGRNNNPTDDYWKPILIQIYGDIDTRTLFSHQNVHFNHHQQKSKIFKRYPSTKDQPKKRKLYSIIIDYYHIASICYRIQTYNQIIMVKGFDPTQNDVASLLLNHIFELVNFGSTLQLQDAHKYVNHWLNHSEYTSALYIKFSTMNVQPVLKLKRKCGLQSASFPSTSMRPADKNFPTVIKDNEITICLDHIRTKLQLKQHLDRQLTFFHRTHLQNTQIKTQKISSKEEEQNIVMRSLYESCHAGYRNYMLDDRITKEMSIICAKYLFFRETKSDLPVDRLFRYTTQLVDGMLI